jgi:hypothetical protein
MQMKRADMATEAGNRARPRLADFSPKYLTPTESSGVPSVAIFQLPIDPQRGERPRCP